ncbi:MULTISPECIES: TlpA family protein disulfide reductase [Sphingobacterium]|uniref:TlpA family protein disulfide reductase n=1 Tax=Sphingobacterium TaxID=28453 RepID=UPI00257DD98B|nr:MULTISPECIES: TlpA disulfide reductase family protein [Sphingobacterium]
MQIFLCNGLALSNCKGTLIAILTAYQRLVRGVIGKQFLYIFCFMLFSCGIARPQSPVHREAVNNNSITPLNIGDQIPDELWNLPLQVVNHPDGKETITLANYKGKLIILDFWATWCGTCLDGLITGTSLQSEFKDDVAIIPVNGISTRDTEVKINASLSKIKADPNLDTDIFSIIQDSILENVFVHKSIPHLVWIDNNGKVVNSTYSNALSKENLDNYRKGHKIELHTKKDNFGFDKNRSLANQIDFDTIEENYDQITFCDYIEGIGTEAGDYKQNSNSSSFRILNYHLSYFYQIAYPSILAGLKNSQIIFTPSVPSGFKKGYVSPENYSDYYCFEYTKRGELTKREAIQKLRETLVISFKTQPYRVNKSVPTLIVSHTPKLNQYLSQSVDSKVQLVEDSKPKYIRRYPISFLLDFLSTQLNIYIDDKVDSSLRFDIDLPDTLDCTNKQMVVAFMKEIGLDVKEHIQNLDFAIFQPVELLPIPLNTTHYEQ